MNLLENCGMSTTFLSSSLFRFSSQIPKTQSNLLVDISISYPLIEYIQADDKNKVPISRHNVHSK